MRIIEGDYDQTSPSPKPPTDLRKDDLHQVRIQGKGVKITLLERENGIDIHIDPSDEPYKHRVGFDDLAAHSTQIRLAGIQGRAL